MPFALLLIGAVILISAIRGTYGQLGAQLKDDLTGGTGGAQHSFLIWIAAIGAVGALGYAPVLRLPSRLLLALVILALLIGNSGFFAKFVQQLNAPPQQAAQAPAAPQLSGSVPVTLTGGSSPGQQPAQQAGGFLGGLFGGGGGSTAGDVASVAAVALV